MLGAGLSSDLAGPRFLALGMMPGILLPSANKNNWAPCLAEQRIALVCFSCTGAGKEPAESKDPAPKKLLD